MSPIPPPPASVCDSGACCFCWNLPARKLSTIGARIGSNFPTTPPRPLSDFVFSACTTWSVLPPNTFLTIFSPSASSTSLEIHAAPHELRVVLRHRLLERGRTRRIGRVGAHTGQQRRKCFVDRTPRGRLVHAELCGDVGHGQAGDDVFQLRHWASPVYMPRRRGAGITVAALTFRWKGLAEGCRYR